MADGKLTGVLAKRWTVVANDGGGELRLPDFVPSRWVEDGRIDRGRQILLRGAGWETFEREGVRYLIPDPELAGYAFGLAHGEYLEAMGRPVVAPSPGPFGDLTDAILLSGAADHSTRLSSGARLLYPDSFSKVLGEGVERRVEAALRGGWVMVGLITDRNDLFLLPPESISTTKQETPDDATIGRPLLERLRRQGLISLRGRGVGSRTVAPPAFPLLPRTAGGADWTTFVADQQQRWGAPEIRPVVDLEVPWLTRFPPLRDYLMRFHPYLEQFDLMRIRYYLDAWEQGAGIEVLDRMIAGIKGVLGEVAARPGIVEEYRGGGAADRVIIVAPQILSAGDVFERSDAVVVRIDANTGGASLETVWEVITTGNPAAHEQANAQQEVSLAAYRKGGILFRRPDGAHVSFGNVEVPTEGIARVVAVTEAAIGATLATTRGQMITAMDQDLIARRRSRGRFHATIDEFAQLLREEGGVERLIEMLGGEVRPGRQYLIWISAHGNKLTSFHVVNEPMLKRFPNHARLGFDEVEGRKVLRDARQNSSSVGSLEMAASWVGGRLNRGLTPVEKVFLGTLLGTRFTIQDEGEAPTLGGLAALLRQRELTPFYEIMRLTGNAPPQESQFLVWSVNNGRIAKLRLVDAAEAKKFSNSTMLQFDLVEGSAVLRKGHEYGALEVAVAWVGGRIHRQLFPVEKAFLGTLLGTVIQPRDETEAATVEGLAKLLREGGIERFHEIMRAVGQEPPAGSQFLLWFEHGDRISSLRLADEEGAELFKRHKRLGIEEFGGKYYPDPTTGSDKLHALLFSGGGTKPSSLGAGVADDLYWAADRRVRGWWHETEGERFPATPARLARYRLADPPTIGARALRYLPSEGVVGLAAVLGAPLAARRLIGIDPLRNPGGFHTASLGALHLVNSAGLAVSDFVIQARNGTSAVRMGSEIVTSPSLVRTFLRSTGGHVTRVGGLASGAIWAYPGYVAGEGIVGLATEEPIARSVAGGVGAIGLPTGLKILIGEEGMKRLAGTLAGRMAGPVGAALLARDLGSGFYETVARRELSDREVLLREESAGRLPWLHRQFCAVNSALFMTGVGIPLARPGQIACERRITREMDRQDGGSRRALFRPTTTALNSLRARLIIRPGNGDLSS